MKDKQQILLIHGGDAYKDYNTYLEHLKKTVPRLERIQSKKDWKNQLQDHLGEDFTVFTPHMPNKQNAQYKEWVILFEKILDLLDEDFILIGCSLGGIFLIKYLSEEKINKKIKQIHLLGTPFDDEEMGSESLNSFLRKGDLKALEDKEEKIFFYHSEDDFAVPFSHFKRYKKELPKANFRAFKNRNHFIQEKVPELIDDITNIEDNI